ncbi:MAG: ComEC/Rec2 family competence protein [Candidatus Moranbacteria bacterium]|nr:ComEC/Rec2 family competence protein [Candidatus Moranbacteria bacterium]
MEKDQVFFFGVLAFIVGVGSGLWFSVPLMMSGLLGSAFLFAVAVVFPRRETVSLSLFLGLWLFGAWYAGQEQVAMASLPTISQSVVGDVRIVRDPEERDFYRQVILRFESCQSETCPNTAILWQAPLSFTAPAGTRLRFSCVLKLPENFTPEFDYRMFLAKDGIGYLCTKADSVGVLSGDLEGTLREALYTPKHVFERGLSQTLAEPEAGLAKGLLLGGNHYLPKDLQDAFTRVGLSHMIAVSGYNITLIAEILLALGLVLGLWRRQAVWTALIGIVFFIVMIGLPASAARAGAMASIVFIALQTGRLAQPVNALLFALGVMLLLNPLLLRYDLGLQLSFLATLGILLLVPYYDYIAPSGIILRKFGEVLFMTFAVELFVLPIILFIFHQFSPLIIVGNFLVLLVPFAMATAFLATLLFLVFPGPHVVLAWGAFLVLTLIVRGVEWLGTITPLFVVEHFTLGALVMWYILLAGGVFTLKHFFSFKSYEQSV